MQVDTIPRGESRKCFFDSIDQASHGETMLNLKATADSCLLVSRLEKDLEMKEFQLMCNHLGKPKQFYKLARFSEVWLRQVLIAFDNPQDKKHFLFVFRIVFPDFLVQELSKSVKAFCMTKDPADT